MDNKTVFNISVCLIGMLILLVHIVNLFIKKERRKDENALLSFFLFTFFHLMVYFIFSLIKDNIANDAFIISSYTIFYIMNNIEALLFYLYLRSYTNIEEKKKKVIDIINVTLFTMFVITDFINIFNRMYFTSINGVYVRNEGMIISQGYQFVLLAISILVVITNKNLNRREKVSFSLYCILPLISIIIQNILKGYAIAYLTMIFSIEILFLFLNVEKNIKIREDEKQLKEANIKMMVSQIQPHFVYNTLSSISTLITIDPDKAQKALDDFTEYLRMNFSTLTATNLVPFKDELKHIKTYVNLEKMRFNDRLNVSYDIQVSSFFVPPLSVQPIVENAIKHGILKKVEGGNISIKTYEEEKAYIIEIEDDGVGFNMDEVDFKGNKHLGLNNVKHRITTMTKGDIIFDSKINEGTKVKIIFYK